MNLIRSFLQRLLDVAKGLASAATGIGIIVLMTCVAHGNRIWQRLCQMCRKNKKPVP